MLSLLYLRFVRCSCDLDILRAQRTMGFFTLVTHKPTWSNNLITWLGIGCHTHFFGQNVFHEKHESNRPSDMLPINIE